MNRVVKKESKPEKKHVCQDCGASFLRPYRLTQHLLLHNNIKTFVCGEENCNKSYTSKSHLDRHINSVHIKTNFDVINRCPDCFKVFSNRQNLKRHMKIKHSKKVVFTCDVCNSNFKKKHLLSTHMFYHTYVKSFRRNTTVGELFERGGEKSYALIIARIEKAVAPFMPDDWKDWLVQDQPPDTLLGNRPRAKQINKIRYAIPTIEIARAFETSELSEKTYRNLKMRLINWPCARTLIYNPHSFAARIHGDNLGTFTNTVKKMKPFLLKREEADNQLNSIMQIPSTRSRRNETTLIERDDDFVQNEDTEFRNHFLATVFAKQTEMFKDMFFGFTRFINALGLTPQLQNQTYSQQNTPSPNPSTSEIREADESFKGERNN